MSFGGDATPSGAPAGALSRFGKPKGRNRGGDKRKKGKPFGTTPCRFNREGLANKKLNKKTQASNGRIERISGKDSQKNRGEVGRGRRTLFREGKKEKGNDRGVKHLKSGTVPWGRVRQQREGKYKGAEKVCRPVSGCPGEKEKGVSRRTRCWGTGSPVGKGVERSDGTLRKRRKKHLQSSGGKGKGRPKTLSAAP